MGLYDTITGNCPSCNEPIYLQTKVGPCDLADVKIGDAFDVADMALELKDQCACGAHITARIKDKHLVALEEGGARVRELAWGKLVPADGDRDAQKNAQVQEFKEFVESVDRIAKDVGK